MPGLPAEAAPALVFIAFGLFGLAGLGTGRVRDALGLAWLLRLLMAAGSLSLALVALAPATWAGMVAASGLQGIHVMMTSAVIAFWSERLFPALPALSFSTALLAMAAGSVLGPALAGVVAEAQGTGMCFSWRRYLRRRRRPSCGTVTPVRARFCPRLGARDRQRPLAGSRLQP